MKKVMFVVVLMLVATSCFAQLQSGPSNVVGYVRVNVGATGYTPFGLPFKFWDVGVGGIPTYGVESTFPSDISGDQCDPGSATTADRIVRQDNGQNAFRDAGAGNAWTGGLEAGGTMVPGRAYWFHNRTGPAQSYVLAGEVLNSGSYQVVSVTNNQYVAYSWRDSRSRNRGDLQLLASGFTGGANITTSDRVVMQRTGSNFWRNTTTNLWDGGLVNVEPGEAFWIQNRNHANTTWIYDYNGGSDADFAVDSPVENAGTIGKVEPAKNTAGKANARD